MKIWAFHFPTKEFRYIEPEQARDYRSKDWKLWYDLRPNQFDKELLSLVNLGEDTIEDDPYIWVHLDQHFTKFRLTECHVSSEGLTDVAVRVFFFEDVCITLAPEDSKILGNVRMHAEKDFREFAKSMGFLLFEIVENALNGYGRTLQELADNNRGIRASLNNSRTQLNIFTETSQLLENLMTLRHHLSMTMEVLSRLTNRKLSYLSEGSQGGLKMLKSRIVLLQGEVVSERDSLASALNLYLGINAHHTNQIMKQLTVVSIIFLPLSFLAAVYGMNLKNIPEYDLEYGYLYFWLLVLSIGIGVFMVQRRYLKQDGELDQNTNNSSFLSNKIFKLNRASPVWNNQTIISALSIGTLLFPWISITSTASISGLGNSSMSMNMFGITTWIGDIGLVISIFMIFASLKNKDLFKVGSTVAFVYSLAAIFYLVPELGMSSSFTTNIGDFSSTARLNAEVEPSVGLYIYTILSFITLFLKTK
jgi:Mg2+ and Co2+ transporter CorA